MGSAISSVYPDELSDSLSGLRIPSSIAKAAEDSVMADWRVFHTPPVLLPHMDIAQRLAVLAAGNLQPMMAEPDREETIGAFLGQPSGLAVGARRELRIRLPEILDAITHAEIPDERRRELRRWFADRVTTSIGATVEAALPGYMDNIVSGRMANMPRAIQWRHGT